MPETAGLSSREGGSDAEQRAWGSRWPRYFTALPGCPGLTRGRQISPVGPQASVWRASGLRALAGEAAIHERGHIRSSRPPAVRGQRRRRSWGPGGGQAQLYSLGGPGRRLEPTWLYEALSLRFQPMPAHPFSPKGPGMTHREAPKIRTAAGF